MGTGVTQTHPRSETASPETSADLEAVRRCRAGDREAFGPLVERWQDRIYGAVLRMVRDAETARDLAQETFVRAYTRLDSFHGDAAFGTWLYAIAVNVVRGDARKRSAQKRRTPLSLDALREDAGRGGVDPVDPAAGAQENVSTAEQCRKLLLELEQLDEESREVVVLREFQDLSYEQIAAALGVPVGTVRSRLFRARAELRRRMTGEAE
jgi:RNA polymerase sigma-70 factor, ECF subfamily